MNAIVPHGHFSDLRSLDHLRFAPQTTHHAAAKAPAPAGAVDHVAAAEELAIGVAARKAAPAAKESARSARDARAHVRQAYRIGRLKGVHALVADAFWRDHVAPRAEQLLTAARQQRDVQRLADHQNANPFKRYVYLLEARERAGNDGAVAQRLDDALDRVWRDHSSEIIAGFNTAGPLMHFARRVDEWDEIRSIYFSWVAHDEPLATTFKALLDKFGPGRMRTAVDTLRDAIAADLASPIVCADKARMQQQQIDLEQNRTISSLIAESETFQRQLEVKDPMPEQVMGFVGAVLDYVAGPANDRKFNALCAVAVPHAEVTEVVRRQVREFMKKKLPVRLWSSAEAREALFPALFRARL